MGFKTSQICSVSFLAKKLRILLGLFIFWVLFVGWFVGAGDNTV
jgi:hypothetical protein